MIRKRFAFAVLVLSTLAGTMLVPEPAQAHGRGWGRGYGRRSYYYDDCYRPRRSYYERYSYGRRYYRPRSYFSIGFHYDDWGPSYGYGSYRRSYGRRYRCGCGKSFASAYWLDYHEDHAHCGY